jgi:anti-anti-sigma factor
MLNVQTKNLGAVAILSAEGQVVIGQTEILRDAVEALAPINSLILDLSHVTIIDAHGLGVMLQLRQQLLAEGVSFELINVSKYLSRIFEITRLNSVFQINSSVEIFPRLVYPQRTSVAA